MPYFKVHYGKDSWNVHDLTGLEVTDLEEKLGCNYLMFDPGRSAKHTLAILATFLLRTKDEEQVEKILKKLTYKQILNDTWTVETDDDMPVEFDGDGGDLPKVTAPTSSTGSSSSRSKRGAGPRQSRGPSPSET